MGIYANAQNLLRKSKSDLETLRQKGLGIVYIGLESDSDQVLACVEKGATSTEMIAAVRKAKEAGLLVSVIGILGLAGPAGSGEHAQRRGQVISQVDEDTCISCDTCADSCQFGALEMGDMFMEVNYEECMGCGVCVDKCDQGAITLARDTSKGVPLEICALMESVPQ